MTSRVLSLFPSAHMSAIAQRSSLRYKRQLPLHQNTTYIFLPLTSCPISSHLSLSSLANPPRTAFNITCGAEVKKKSSSYYSPLSCTQQDVFKLYSSSKLVSQHRILGSASDVAEHARFTDDASRASHLPQLLPQRPITNADRPLLAALRSTPSLPVPDLQPHVLHLAPRPHINTTRASLLSSRAFSTALRDSIELRTEISRSISPYLWRSSRHSPT